MSTSRGSLWVLVALTFLLEGRPDSAPAPIPPSTRAGIEASVASLEYHARSSDAGLQAPNRRQNLRTYFASHGIRVHDRTAAGSPELIDLRVAAFGREDAGLSALPAGDVSADGARVEIRRPDFVEWYENRPEGLEQGFTLRARPPGAEALRIELQIRGAQARQAGDEVEIVADETGRRLRYGKLVSIDAAGRELPGAIEVASADRIVLRVDDAGATYPVIVDPILRYTADAQLEGDQASAHFGTSVAGAGDVNGDGFADVIVGAPDFDAGQNGEGGAFIFHGSAAGIPNAGAAAAATQLESNLANALLGQSVAGAGDVNGDGYADVIVGAPFYNAGQSGEGSAFVFLGGAAGVADGNPTTASARLESNQADANLGWSVAGAGDVNGDGYADVIVGARFYDTPSLNAGAAFVFHGSASGVANGNPATAARTLPSGQQGGFFGSAVAGAGDVNADGYADVIVGAYSMGLGATSDGAAFIFHGSATGTQPVASANLISNQSGAYFGDSVAGAGDVNGDGYADVIVGAPLFDDPEFNEGAAFVFLGGAFGVQAAGPAGAWSKITEDVGSAAVGTSVAGAGDVNGDGLADVLVGAPYVGFGQTAEGVMWLYLGSATAPLPLGSSLELDQVAAFVGTSVAGAGDVNGDGFADVIAGAPYFTNGAGQSEEGAAFVALGGLYRYREQMTDDPNARSILGLHSQDAVGGSVAAAGDVNGDGFDDLIVSAYGFDSGPTASGAAFLFHGSPTGFAGTTSAGANTSLVATTFMGFGVDVAGAGDVNNDGYADVIVGALEYQGRGAAFLFHGSSVGVASGNEGSAAATLLSDQDASQFGSAVASAGDVNGDGFADVIVGAWRYHASAADNEAGGAFIYHGGPQGIPSAGLLQSTTQLVSLRPQIRFGDDVASAGDVNGDGYGDVVIGAPGGTGSVFVYHGGSAGIPDGNTNTAARELSIPGGATSFGANVASAGDVNGDAFGDVVIGAPLDTASSGSFFVFHGSPAGLPAAFATRVTSEFSNAQLGSGVAAAGDVNHDGFSDVLVGALNLDTTFPDTGAALVFAGSATGIPSSGINAPALVRLYMPVQSGSWFGESVAGLGDVDGDGEADLAVGAHFFDTSAVDAGAAFVFPAHAGVRTKPIELHTFRGANSGAQTEPWGSSVDVDDFKVRMSITSPAGRESARLEVETCPPATPFGAAACIRTVEPTFSDLALTPTGQWHGLTIGGLVQNRLYRYRVRAQYAPLSATVPGITPPIKPAHGIWHRPKAQALEADLRTARDSDLDGVFDPVDNCPTVANANQADGDADGVGSVCDNCSAAANPRVALSAGFLRVNPWATLTGGQRDDDFDGYGNRCDAKFPGVTGSLVGPGDLTQFRVSNGKNRTTDGCGTLGTRPCAIFDLDESALVIGPADLSRFRALTGKLPGPRCATCPLTCQAGAQGSCAGP